MIYTLQVFTYHDYGEDNKIVACFTDEDNIKTLVLVDGNFTVVSVLNLINLKLYQCLIMNIWILIY